MSKSKSEFLNPSAYEYAHHFRGGEVGEFAWLTSPNLKLREFFNTSPKLAQFRILARTPAGPLTTDILKSEGIDTLQIGDWWLSEPMNNWLTSRKFVVTSCFLIPSETQVGQCQLFVEKNDHAFSQLWEQPPENFPEKVIFDSCDSLNAIAYIQQSSEFALVAKQDIIRAFQGSDFFLGFDLVKRSQIIEQRQKFIASCGPEVGPEKCIEAKCAKLRIEVAVRCLEHQFFAMNGAIVKMD